MALGTESQYLVGGARITWKHGTPSVGIDRDARISMSFTDMLGSNTAVVDLVSGSLMEAGMFYPSGARETRVVNDSVAGGFSLEPMGFTGKEEDEEVGLTYFGERYLIPRLARWASPDPLQVHAMGGGEAMNSYHYVAGNLLQARDPVGLDPTPPGLSMNGSGRASLELSQQEISDEDRASMAAGVAEANTTNASVGYANLLNEANTGSNAVTPEDARRHEISWNTDSQAWTSTHEHRSLSPLGEAVYSYRLRQLQLDVASSDTATELFMFMAPLSVAAVAKMRAAPLARRLARVRTNPRGPAARGIVRSRINLANGRVSASTPRRLSGQMVSAGMDHIVEQHFGREVANNRSVFTISRNRLGEILQSEIVVRSPVVRISGDSGDQFVRTVNTGQVLGRSSLNNGGGLSSWIRVITDRLGNIVTAFPL